MKTNPITPSQIKRLTHLKYTIDVANKYLSDLNDIYRFGIGICLLHDAIENLYWTLGSVKRIKIDDKMTIFEKNENAIKIFKSKISLNKTNLEELNTIRNAYKHKGIPPNTAHASPIISQLISDFFYTVKQIFKIDLNNISLALLIENQNLRDELEKVIAEVGKKSQKYQIYKKALLSLGRIYFDYHEKALITSSFTRIMREARAKARGEKIPRYKFIEEDLQSLEIDLLELGISPYLYHRFCNLVPKFGIDTINDEIVPNFSSVMWGKENWTKLNVEYCINWLIEFFLKKQTLYKDNGYKIEYHPSRSHVFRSIHQLKVNFDIGFKHNEKEVVIEKNKLYLGHFMSYCENNWCDYDNESNNTNLIIYGLTANGSCSVPKAEFKISEVHTTELSQDTLAHLLESGEQLINSNEVKA